MVNMPVRRITSCRNPRKSSESFGWRAWPGKRCACDEDTAKVRVPQQSIGEECPILFTALDETLSEDSPEAALCRRLINPWTCESDSPIVHSEIVASSEQTHQLSTTGPVRWRFERVFR
jgi:hypothetical protein